MLREAYSQDWQNHLESLFSLIQKISWEPGGILNGSETFDSNLFESLSPEEKAEVIAKIAIKVGWVGLKKLLPSCLLEAKVVERFLNLNSQAGTERALSVLSGQTEIYDLPVKISDEERGSLMEMLSKKDSKTGMIWACRLRFNRLFHPEKLQKVSHVRFV